MQFSSLKQNSIAIAMAIALAIAIAITNAITIVIIIAGKNDYTCYTSIQIILVNILTSLTNL